jgi:isopenicillin-N epimerase
MAVENSIAIAKAWNTDVDGAPALHGSMMAVRLPARLQRWDPARLMAELLRRRRVAVAVMRVEGELWARISAQIYNVSGDYDRLQFAEAEFAQ